MPPEDHEQPTGEFVSREVLQIVVECSTTTARAAGQVADALDDTERRLQILGSRMQTLETTCQVMTDRIGQVLESRRWWLRFLWLILPFVAGIGVAGGWWANPKLTGGSDGIGDQIETAPPR